MRTLILAAVAGSMAFGGNARAGRLGGGIDHRDQVLANHTDNDTVVLIAAQTATIYVVGDGDTDLDLDVSDENENLIGKDEDATDTCLVKIRPNWTGKFKVRIMNRGGLSNNHRLVID